jgi:hypothetical protein
MNNIFVPYQSRYSGAFELLDTFKYPKMCAQQSLNLTNGVDYYRGQNSMSYVIGEQSSYGSVVSQMDRGQNWLFQNGSAANPYLGKFDRYDEGGTFKIFTQNEDDIGKHRTILRGCSRFNQLIELYLYTEVFTNSFPDFIEDLETVHIVYVNETKTYKLPALTDDENNDKSLVFIDYDLDPTKRYPPFMFYNNITETLTFRPESKWIKGETYHFRVIVKEENSDVISFSYACQVTVQGDTIDPMEELTFTNIEYDMNPIDRYSNTSI